MLELFGIISFFITIVFLVLAIVSKLKKTGKVKKRLLYATGFFILFLIMMAIVGATNPLPPSKSTPKQNTQSTAPTVTQKKESKKENTTTKTQEKPKVQLPEKKQESPKVNTNIAKPTLPKTTDTADSQAIAASTEAGSNFKSGPDKVAVAGGLGDTYKTIQSIYGNTTMVMQKMNQGIGFYKFKNNTLQFGFNQGRVDHVTYPIDSNPISLENAKLFAKQMLPPDAKFIKEYSDGIHTIDVYQSNALIPLFNSDEFKNTEGVIQPGYCDMGYTIDENGKVTVIDSFVSDNA